MTTMMKRQKMEETEVSGTRNATTLPSSTTVGDASTEAASSAADGICGNSKIPPPSLSLSNHNPGAVRFAEKRRIGTCPFADRIATISLECYRSHIPISFQQNQPQTCIATIVAHFAENDTLQVQSLGVGTKFLSESVLQQEDESEIPDIDGHVYGPGYGRRVRDCHAEVLARRAFRRQLYAEIIRIQKQSQSRLSSGHTQRILEQYHHSDDEYDNQQHDQYTLRSGVTLHMYCSSAPCGNATLKKFATMQKEVYNPTQKLWYPSSSSDNKEKRSRTSGTTQIDQPQFQQEECHEQIPPHSLKLGQFALLLKKDRTSDSVSKTANNNNKDVDGTYGPSSNLPAFFNKHWPANQSDDWCPPGTTIVWSNQGSSSSIHTCSDKICRWNILGLQGSLLSSLLIMPKSSSLLSNTAPALYMSSLTVGRKFTSCICRRAVCCRATSTPRKNKTKPQQRDMITLQNDCMMKDNLATVKEPSKSQSTTTTTTSRQESSPSSHPWSPFSLVHPSILGTGVYMDDDGVLPMNESSEFGQDVRIHSPLCYAWWPGCNNDGAAHDDGNNVEAVNPPKQSNQGTTECINGTTGYATVIQEHLNSNQTSSTMTAVSQISTAALLRLHHEVMMHKNSDRNRTNPTQLNSRHDQCGTSLSTVESIRSFKEQTSPIYEMAKTKLLSKHPLFRGWKRRLVNEVQEKNQQQQKFQQLKRHREHQVKLEKKKHDSGTTDYQKGTVVKVSRALSWALRHAAPQLGLEIGSDGYVPLEQLLHHEHPKLKCIMNQDLVFHVVQSNDKQRFSIMERGHDDSDSRQWYIRANQGHSIPNILDPYQLLTPIDPSNVGTIVHGTYMEAWTNHIRLMGLSKMNRTHIHFAKGLPTEEGVISGMRSSCDVLIYVNGAKCGQEGIVFFESANGVILTEGKRNGFLPTDYFSHVTTKTGQVLLDQREMIT